MGARVLTRRAAALALAAGAALACLGAPSRAAARHPWTVPHELRYATGEDVSSLNPHLDSQTTLSYLSSLTMAWLVRYDEHNRPVPELATAVPSRANGGISADGKTITYRLRRDARWSDGVPFTAADVAFSVGVVRNPANNESTHEGFDLIDRVDTPDPYTVVFRLKRPHAGFYVNFFGSAFAQPCILPKHLLANLASINDAPYNALPVGIGPFKYASWRRGDRVEVVRDPLYFGRKPKLDRVVFKIVPDRNTLLTQLRTHEIDLWLPVAGAYVERVTGLDGIGLLRRPSYIYSHLDFQVQHGALREPAVRRALRLAIDRRTILEKIVHGVGTLQETPLPPGHPFHLDVPLVPYDLAAANRMLDAAGWVRGADGVRTKRGERLAFTFATSTGTPDADQMIELIRASWAQAGAAIDVRRYPSSLLFANEASGGIIRRGTFDVAFFGWLNSPDGDLTNLFACDRTPPRGQNVLRYCDPAVDRALARFEGSYDERVQREALADAQRRIVSDAPTVVMYARQDVFAFNDDLHGFEPNQVTPFDDLVDADI